MHDYLNDPRILRQLIMDHYEHPRNRRLSDDPGYCLKHMASDSCIDDIKVQIKVEEGVIRDLCFDGVGCTISTASTSMMTELLRNKTLSEAKEIMEAYQRMIRMEEVNQDLLREAIAFQNVGKQLNRINCATIGWRAVAEMVEEKENEHE